MLLKKLGRSLAAMASTPQHHVYEPGEYVWYLDEHDQRRAAVVVLGRDGELIVTGVGMERRDHSWRVPDEDVATRLSPRSADEHYL